MTEKEANKRHLDFIRAVLAELEHVAKDDRSKWSCKSHLPVVPHTAQLSLLGILLLKGLASGPDKDAVMRQKLTVLLNSALRRSQAVWADALVKRNATTRDKLLDDRYTIRPEVMEAVKFSDWNVGRAEMPLSAFVDNVQDALAKLSDRITALVESILQRDKLAGRTAGVPSAVYGALAVTSIAGGMVGRRVMSGKEVSAARVAVKLAEKKDESKEAAPQSVKRLRQALEELGPHLPERRA